jgi:inner membrane organizing system protein 1
MSNSINPRFHSKFKLTKLNLDSNLYAATMSEKEKNVRSEDELGKKWDRCIADTIVKTGAGIGVGMVFSLLLFRRRPWPVTLGGGFGLGYALSNCQHDFKRMDSLYLKSKGADTKS